MMPLASVSTVSDRLQALAGVCFPPSYTPLSSANALTVEGEKAAIASFSKCPTVSALRENHGPRVFGA